MAQNKDGGDSSDKGLGGPRTKRGKKRSSLNALKHGRRSRGLKAEGTDSAAFRAFRWRLERNWAPASEPERFLARRFADISWRMNQAWEEEARIFNEAADGVPGPRGWAQVFLKEESAAALDQWITRKEALDREMDEFVAIMTRRPGRATAPEQLHETEKSPTDPLLTELVDSLRKRAGSVLEERISRSFDRVLGTISRKISDPF